MVGIADGEKMAIFAETCSIEAVAEEEFLEDVDWVGSVVELKSGREGRELDGGRDEGDVVIKSTAQEAKKRGFE